jgi:mono/diheme cytochrome c family protein
LLDRTRGSGSGRSPLVFALVAFAALAGAPAADERTDDTRRFLDLLTGVRIAYMEAFEDGEDELVAPDQLEEARLLVREAQSLNERLSLVPAASLATIARRLESPVGGIDLPPEIQAMTADVTAKTGVARDTRPTAKPSAVRGRELFPGNCTGCHGARGAGDGADAARAGIKPADFTDVLLMRRETPSDFFDRVTLGHRRRGMPEWTALTPLQRWDLVAYVWTLHQSAADRAEAKRLWTDRCASCHGAAGGGVEGKAADFTRPGSLVDRTDRALFVVLSRKPHGTANAGLTDEQRWRLVGRVRDLSLGGD